MEYEFIGKSLLVTERGVRVLVIADLHLGYDQALRESGVFVPGFGAFKQTMRDVKEIFERVRRVNYVVLLGDVKHVFGRILTGENEEMGVLFGYLLDKCEKIIVVKGNHDVLIEYAGIEKERVKIVKHWVWKTVCFLHGDRDFKEGYDKNAKVWIMGHYHPAVALRDSVKSEKYKCFLVGYYKKRKIIILPSFFPGNVGSDPRERRQGLAWSFYLRKFGVKIVGEGLAVLDFGELGNLQV